MDLYAQASQGVRYPSIRTRRDLRWLGGGKAVRRYWNARCGPGLQCRFHVAGRSGCGVLTFEGDRGELLERNLVRGKNNEEHLREVLWWVRGYEVRDLLY